MLQYCRHLPTESLRRGGLTHCKCAPLQSCKLSSARCSMRMTIALFKCWIVYELTRTGKGVTVVTTGRLVDWPTTARARMPHTPITPHFFWMLSPSEQKLSVGRLTAWCCPQTACPPSQRSPSQIPQLALITCRMMKLYCLAHFQIHK